MHLEKSSKKKNMYDLLEEPAILGAKHLIVDTLVDFNFKLMSEQDVLVGVLLTNSRR